MQPLPVVISVSKIQFESKSQQRKPRPRATSWWLSVCQRYNLKANHNVVDGALNFLFGGYQCVKDTIWKQITTTKTKNRREDKVVISVSKIQFESKSQLWRLRRLPVQWWLSVCQRYNLKANHNWPYCVVCYFRGGYQCVKDTIWKQITTLVW